MVIERPESRPMVGPAGPVRLRTLVLIRWVAVAGQAVTLLAVHFGFGFALPIVPALAVVAASALFNLAVGTRRPPGTRLGAGTATAHLAYDIVQISVLLALSGGLENPFAVLILAPVIVSATVLPRRSTIALGFFTGAGVTLLAFVHLPVPLGDPFNLPLLYVVGIWEALILAVLFIGIYVGSVAEEARRMSDALAATQMALAREQQLSALGALAAAAAHNLGSPLSTIAVTAREMQREIAAERAAGRLPADSTLSGDVGLVIEQTGRCREILAALARRPRTDAGDPYSHLPVSALVAAAAEPHRDDAVTLVIDAGPGPGPTSEHGEEEPEPAAEPTVLRRAEIVHGLGNLIQNAIQHARRRALVTIRWTARDITVTIADDGPGFAPALRDRLGDPYLSDDRARRAGGSGHMGLGIFIARTLLSRTGATLAFANRPGDAVSGGGAEVTVKWRRSALEAPR